MPVFINKQAFGLVDYPQRAIENPKGLGVNYYEWHCGINWKHQFWRERPLLLVPFRRLPPEATLLKMVGAGPCVSAKG